MIMNIRETEEYRLVKQLTKKENKEAIKRTAIASVILMGLVYSGMYGYSTTFGERNQEATL